MRLTQNQTCPLCISVETESLVEVTDESTVVVNQGIARIFLTCMYQEGRIGLSCAILYRTALSLLVTAGQIYAQREEDIT
jgi:hypothetical protein